MPSPLEQVEYFILECREASNERCRHEDELPGYRAEHSPPLPAFGHLKENVGNVGKLRELVPALSTFGIEPFEGAPVPGFVRDRGRDIATRHNGLPCRDWAPRAQRPLARLFGAGRADASVRDYIGVASPHAIGRDALAAPRHALRGRAAAGFADVLVARHQRPIPNKVQGRRHEIGGRFLSQRPRPTTPPPNVVRTL